MPIHAAPFSSIDGAPSSSNFLKKWFDSLREFLSPLSSAKESRDLRKRFQSASVPAICSRKSAEASEVGICAAEWCSNSFWALKRAVVKYDTATTGKV